MVFALVFAVTMTTALVSPLSFKAADAMVFAAVAGTMTALFSSLSKTITNQVSEIDKETSSVKYFDDKLIHFND